MTFPTSSEVKIISQKLFFSSIWGNFVLYGTALLLLFLFSCSLLRVKVSKYQGDEPMLIALHSDRSIWMLFCVPKLMFVFLRKIFPFFRIFVSNNF